MLCIRVLLKLLAGLRLTLNIEQAEYLGLFSHKAGVRVTVHPFNVTPFPEDLGLNAMPGSETEIGVTVVSNKFPVGRNKRFTATVISSTAPRKLRSPNCFRFQELVGRASRQCSYSIVALFRPTLIRCEVLSQRL